MSTQILLPKLGFSMNEGSLSQWLVADGAIVKEGEPLYALESEKSVQEIESPASGTLKILVQPGEVYPVGVRELCRRLAEESVWRAQTLESIQRQSTPHARP